MESCLDLGYLCLLKVFFQLHHFQSTWRRNLLSDPQLIKGSEQIFYAYQDPIDHLEQQIQEMNRFEPVHNCKTQSNTILKFGMLIRSKDKRKQAKKIRAAVGWPKFISQIEWFSTQINNGYIWCLTQNVANIHLGQETETPFESFSTPNIWKKVKKPLYHNYLYMHPEQERNLHRGLKLSKNLKFKTKKSGKKWKRNPTQILSAHQQLHANSLLLSSTWRLPLKPQ